MRRSFLRFNALSIFALVVMGLGADSHGGTDFQGTDFQGTDFQGTDFQGTELGGAGEREAWLQGARLVGVRVDPRTAELLLIEVLAFRGQAVEVLQWSAGAGPRARVLRPHDLIGLEWAERRCRAPGPCARRRYRIIAAEPDTSMSTMPEHGDNRDLWLYQLEHSAADALGSAGWHPVCPADRHGEARGLFVDGRWQRDGAWRPEGYTFACTAGVVAKCARNWGYKPWKRLPARHGRMVSLGPLHRACTRAARADYCGDGSSHTREGTLVDLFDDHGFNVAAQDPALVMEAGFSEQGAAWVARSRWPMDRAQQGAWLDLGACRRPAQPAPGARERALIHVQSHVQSRVQSRP